LDILSTELLTDRIKNAENVTEINLRFYEIQLAVQKLSPISQTLGATREIFEVKFISHRCRDTENKGTNPFTSLSNV